jgi:hypothetical protein
MVLHGTNDRLIEIGVCCEVEMNMEVNKVEKTSWKIKNNWRMWNVSAVWVE